MAQPYILISPVGAWAAESWIRIGVRDQSDKRWQEAERSYRLALSLEPGHAAATNNLAVLYAQSGHLNVGLVTIERASLLKPTPVQVLINWSLMCIEAYRMEEALLHAEEAHKLEPCQETSQLLHIAYSTSGRQGESLPYLLDVVRRMPKHTEAMANVCFAQTLSDCSLDEMLVQRMRFRTEHGYNGVRQPHTNQLGLIERKLRVGYVGGDFKTHSAASIFKGVILDHGEGFEPYIYSTLLTKPELDPRTREFKDKIPWRDIEKLDDEAADALIRKDGIDILVDLAGHTAGGRIPLFSRKPAPVQITAWGFAVGTGCPEIDYFFADAVTVPEEESPYYLESIVHLPCIITFNPPVANLSTSSPLPFFENESITFGFFARYEKMSDLCLLAIQEILLNTPGSCLLCKDGHFDRPEVIRRVRGMMHKIDPSRLLFLGGTTHEDHMQSMQRCDMMLDPFPHSGGVGSLEQLYMGVPVVTLCGKTPAGRLTSSVLTQIKRTEWIAKDVSAYIDIASALAINTSTLRDARKTLSKELMESPVVKGYTKAVEDVYREVWSYHVKQEAKAKAEQALCSVS